MINPNSLDQVSTIFKRYTKKPELFLSKQEIFVAKFKKATKILYDIALKLNDKDSKLPELIINGFDNEQIWQQLELQNKKFLKQAIREAPKFRVKEKKNEDCEEVETQLEDGSEHNEGESSEEEASNNFEEDEEDEEIDLDDEKSGDEILEPNIKKSNKTSIVDDEFFKLDEMEEFLKQEERREEQSKSKPRNKTLSESEDDLEDELIDYFQDIPDEIDETEGVNKSSLIRYNDFFDKPRKDWNPTYYKDRISLDGESKSADETQDETNLGKEINSKKKVQFNLDNISVASSKNTPPEKDENITNNEEINTKSSLEKRQERLKKKIDELEEEAISEKPWQLKGEVSGRNRPQNSLLEEFVEFDVVSRPAPVITEQTTLKLEDIIKRRMQDNAWDDVEKKFKPVETPMEYKKKLILNQEKSKESLAQIYENEYIKQRDALNQDDNFEEKEKEEPPVHNEIREAMHSLFRKLDALSNFHYTPKMAKPELKIISNIPALNMEEVAPVTTSDATLLAPEEVKGKPRGDLIGKSERTKTDIKRDRRKKKKKQQIHAKNKMNPDKLSVVELKKQKKNDKNVNHSKLVKNLKKQRNVITTNASDTKVLKSSTAFFTQLQDEVKSSIKRKVAKASEDNKNTLSAKKLKL